MTVKILEDNSTRVYNCRCAKCTSAFSYTVIDVDRDMFGGNPYVECPVCHAHIDHIQIVQQIWKKEQEAKAKEVVEDKK